MPTPPKSAAIHRLNGNPSRTKRCITEPPFPLGSPELPEGLPGVLSDRAKEHWTYALEQLAAVPGMLALIDRDALFQYALAWDEFYAACDEIREHGMIAYSDKGSPYQNPAVGIKHKAMAAILKIGAKFCMSPADRVGKSFGDGVPPTDPLMEMMKLRAKNN